jgi:transcriptional regulator with XRE-family HTH domain
MSLSLGQSANYINMIENKKSNPSMSVFYYICEYFGITPKEFFDCEDVDPKQARGLLDEIKKLDGRSREYILGLIREINNRPK